MVGPNTVVGRKFRVNENKWYGFKVHEVKVNNIVKYTNIVNNIKSKSF